MLIIMLARRVGLSVSVLTDMFKELMEKLRGYIQTILEKINVIMTLGGGGGLGPN